MFPPFIYSPFPVQGTVTRTLIGSFVDELTRYQHFSSRELHSFVEESEFSGKLGTANYNSLSRPPNLELEFLIKSDLA